MNARILKMYELATHVGASIETHAVDYLNPKLGFTACWATSAHTSRANGDTHLAALAALSIRMAPPL